MAREPKCEVMATHEKIEALIATGNFFAYPNKDKAHDPQKCAFCQTLDSQAKAAGHQGGQCRPNPNSGGHAWNGVYGWYAP